MPTIKRRPKRSVKLSTDEKRKLKKWVGSKDTNYDAVVSLGISEPTFYRVMRMGSCKQAIYDRIKKIAQL